MGVTLKPPLPESLSLLASLEGALPCRTEKPWGHELLWAWGHGYAAKILHIESGARLSLQYHEVKEETVMVVRGRLGLYLEGPSGQMEYYEAVPGQVFHIPCGRKHRMAALETCDVLETSTPELEDLVRLQDDFGRV